MKKFAKTLSDTGATGMQKESSTSGNIQRKKKKTMEDQGES